MKFDKSKVYSALNADEVKIGSKGYFADCITELKDKVEYGEEELSTVTYINSENSSYRFAPIPGTNYNLFYLVEESKKKKLRPYKDANEIIKDFLKRCRAYGNFPLEDNPLLVPSIWLKNMNNNAVCHVDAIEQDEFVHITGNRCALRDVFENFTYLDGTPFGIVE